MSGREQVNKIIKENDRRNEAIYAKFNPVTGEGSIGGNVQVCLSDFVMPVQWLPNTMMKIPFVKKLILHGSQWQVPYKRSTCNSPTIQTMPKRFLRSLSDYVISMTLLSGQPHLYTSNLKEGIDVLLRADTPSRKLLEVWEQGTADMLSVLYC